MNHVIDRIVKISLILMILLSLLLSYKIWTKPANRSLTDKAKDNSEKVIHAKKMTDVYVPTKLFYHQTKDKCLYSNKESMILDINEKITAFEFKNGK